MRTNDRPGGGMNVVRRAPVSVYRHPVVTTKQKPVTVMDSRSKRHKRIKSNTYNILFADSNVAVARLNYVYGENYEYYLRKHIRNAYSTTIIPNYDENGGKSFVENAVTRTRTIRNVFATVFVISTIVSMILAFTASFWWLSLGIASVISLILMMTVKYKTPFLSKIDIQGSFSTKVDIRDPFSNGDELAERLAELLSTHEKSHIISSLLRRKCEIEDNWETVTDWASTLCNIFALDPNYSVEVIPLMNEDLKEIFDKLDEIDRKQNSVESVREAARLESEIQKNLALDRIERLEIGS